MKRRREKGRRGELELERKGEFVLLQQKQPGMWTHFKSLSSAIAIPFSELCFHQVWIEEPIDRGMEPEGGRRMELELEIGG